MNSGGLAISGVSCMGYQGSKMQRFHVTHFMRRIPEKIRLSESQWNSLWLRTHV